ncbi:MAG: hypothetical protein HY747_04990, partial [Elusimicrobia bacterium]|nr:hypothetical protein [Elusimicrobiota bacterium]
VPEALRSGAATTSGRISVPEALRSGAATPSGRISVPEALRSGAARARANTGNCTKSDISMSRRNLAGS